MTRFAFLAPTLTFVVSICLSGTKTFTREYTYAAGEADSKLTARTIALEQVKRILLEEVGVYVKSRFETEDWEKREGDTWKSGSLTKKQMTSIAAGITETKILEEQWTGEKFYVRAEIVVDTADVARRAQSIAEDESKLAELELSRRAADDALVEIRRLQEELKLAKSDAQKAATQQDYSLETNRLSATDWFERGYSNAILGNDQAALVDFTKAIELKSDAANAYYNRGVVKSKLGDNQGAIADHSKAIDLKPTLPFAYGNRGAAKHEIGDNVGAITDYTKAIQLKQDYAIAYCGRGNAKDASGDHHGAIQDYTKAIELDPQCAEAYYNRGIAEAGSEDPPGAIQDFTKAIEINPQYADAYCNRGIAKSMLEDHRGAIQDFARAIEINPRVPESYVNRGNSKRILGDHDGAIEDYSKAIEIRPGLAEAYFGRGIVNMNIRDNRGAVIDFTKAIELKPEDAVFHDNLGYVYLDTGELSLAIKSFKNCIRLDNRSWDALLGSALAYFETKDMPNARDYLFQARDIEPKLNEGMNGITKLESVGYFYSEKAKQTLRELFQAIK